MRPRAVGAEGRTIGFADGSELEVDAVIWATGYRPDHSWIELPIHGDDGRLRHRRGVTEVPGLYFLGLSWQHTRGSALLGFVADDAAFIAGQIGGGVERGTGDERQSRPAGSGRRRRDLTMEHHEHHEHQPRPRRQPRRTRALPDGDRRPARGGADRRSSSSATATGSSSGSRPSRSGSATTPCA